MAKKRAAKSKAKKSASGKKVGKQKGAGATQMIPAKEVQKLLDRCRAMSREISSDAGTLGTLISDAVEKHNLDKVSFGIVRRFDRMPDAKLAFVVPYLAYLMDVCGIDERAAKQGKLFEKQAEDEAANVASFPRRATRSTPAEGEGEQSGGGAEDTQAGEIAGGLRH